MIPSYLPASLQFNALELKPADTSIKKLVYRAFKDYEIEDQQYTIFIFKKPCKKNIGAAIDENKKIILINEDLIAHKPKLIFAIYHEIGHLVDNRTKKIAHAVQHARIITLSNPFPLYNPEYIKQSEIKAAITATKEGELIADRLACDFLLKKRTSTLKNANLALKSIGTALDELKSLEHCPDYDYEKIGHNPPEIEYANIKQFMNQNRYSVYTKTDGSVFKTIIKRNTLFEVD